MSEYKYRTAEDVIEAMEKADRLRENGHATVFTDPRLPTIKSSAEFVKDFVPPDYLVDGLLQEGFLLFFDWCHWRRQDRNYLAACSKHRAWPRICWPRNQKTAGAISRRRKS